MGYGIWDMGYGIWDMGAMHRIRKIAPRIVVEGVQFKGRHIYASPSKSFENGCLARA
jgi:hypothetical protein